MIIYLDESDCKAKFYPLAEIRHVADLRLGILTLREKWELRGYEVSTGEPGSALKLPSNTVPADNIETLPQEKLEVIEYPWDLFRLNVQEIRKDFELLTRNRQSANTGEGNRLINSKMIFIEEGAKVRFSILNAENGPIYIGKNAEVMEGSMIRGPFSLGENSVVKMGSKIYGGTTIGPNCVAGGEIKNSILIANSNKAHDGYLGDSVIGEWCNLGAGTSNSNVKNTGSEVRYQYHDSIHTAGIKAGLIMGDYSRCAINTSFNTGTIVGICCNIFDEKPPKFISDFSWGTEKYDFEKAIKDIRNWKQMKGQDLNDNEIRNLKQLYLKK